jgi:hypothetical protein
VAPVLKRNPWQPTPKTFVGSPNVDLIRAPRTIPTRRTHFQPLDTESSYAPSYVVVWVCFGLFTPDGSDTYSHYPCLARLNTMTKHALVIWLWRHSL